MKNVFLILAVILSTAVYSQNYLCLGEKNDTTCYKLDVSLHDSYLKVDAINNTVEIKSYDYFEGEGLTSIHPTCKIKFDSFEELNAGLEKIFNNYYGLNITCYGGHKNYFFDYLSDRAYLVSVFTKYSNVKIFTF